MSVITRSVVVAVALGLSAAACSGDDDAAEEQLDASSRTTVDSGAGAGVGGGLCDTYSSDDIEERLGLPVDDGTPAGPGGTACQWDASDDDAAYVQIQVIDDVEFWEVPDLAEGFESIADLGQEGFVVPELGGWKAGALTDTSVAYVSMAGGDSDKDATVDLLRDLLRRA